MKAQIFHYIKYDIEGNIGKPLYFEIHIFLFEIQSYQNFLGMLTLWRQKNFIK